jgi:AcrR family transcriptional regulator
MADSRSALLGAAAEEFARYGLKGARVQDIVRKAGVNERMIYHHFGSKAGLHAAVLEFQLQDLCSVCRPALDRSLEMSPYAGMRLVLASYLDALLTRPELVGLLLHEALGGWPTASRTGATCAVGFAGAPSARAARGCLPGGPSLRGGPRRVDQRALRHHPPAAAVARWEQHGPVDASALRDHLLRPLLHGMSGPAPA